MNPPWQATAYDVSQRLFQLTSASLRAAFVGFWLGLLDRRALQAADELYYRRAQMYHREKYNLSGLFDWERSAVDRHFGGCRSLLVSSAGGGREVVALERLGCEVAAFECNATLVQAGNALLAREGLASRIAPAQRDMCPAYSRLFDGIVVGWGSYMLMQGRERRVTFLRQLRAHVPEGAPLLVSFFVRPGDTRYLRLVARLANQLRRIRRTERVELGDDLVPNFVHHFSRAEIEDELAAGGFTPGELTMGRYPHLVAVAARDSSTSSLLD